MKVVYSSIFDIGYVSHMLNHVGGTPQLTLFSKHGFHPLYIVLKPDYSGKCFLHHCIPQQDGGAAMKSSNGCMMHFLEMCTHSFAIRSCLQQLLTDIPNNATNSQKLKIELPVTVDVMHPL